MNIAPSRGKYWFPLLTLCEQESYRKDFYPKMLQICRIFNMLFYIFFQINVENALCPKHPGESMTLNCLDCHNIQICDTCFEENHKGEKRQNIQQSKHTAID